MCLEMGQTRESRCITLSLSSKDESDIWATGIPVTILNSLYWNNLEFWETMKEEYNLHALYPDFQFFKYYHSCFILFVLLFMYMHIIFNKIYIVLSIYELYIQIKHIYVFYSFLYNSIEDELKT